MNAKNENTNATTNASGIVKRTNAYFIDPTMVVRREGWNPRFDFGDIKELVQSIKANGVLNPIRVKRVAGNFELIDGDRRMTAIEALLKEGHTFEGGIPAIILDKAIEDVEALIQMFEANTGKAFLPLEEAAAYQRMRDAGMTLKQICSRVGRAHVHVVKTMALLTADESVKDAVKDGTVNSTLAKEIATKARGNKAKQKELVETAKKGGKAGKKLAKEEAKSIKKRPTSKKGQQTVEPAALKPLTSSQLDTRESVLMNLVSKGLKAVGISEDKARAMFADSDEQSLAFHFGALMGIRAAQGKDPKITL